MRMQQTFLIFSTTLFFAFDVAFENVGCCGGDANDSG